MIHSSFLEFWKSKLHCLIYISVFVVIRNTCFTDLLTLLRKVRNTYFHISFGVHKQCLAFCQIPALQHITDRCLSKIEHNKRYIVHS